MQVLVLDGHTHAAMEVVQALGRVGASVDVACEAQDCLAFHSRYVRWRLVWDPSRESGAFVGWLREVDAKTGYDLIVPSSETSLVRLSPLEDGDPLRAKAILPPRRSMDIALDKQQTWDLARKLRVPLPPSTLIERLDRLPPVPTYPVVLKPIRSKVSLGRRLASLRTQVVHSDAQRVDFLRAWLAHGPIQQQEYVHGHGVGVDLLYSRGRKAWHFAHERIHEQPLTGGASSYRRSMVPSPELLKSAEVLLDELRWHGVAMVEYKLCPDGTFYLVEVNPRLWGSLALAIDAGVNFPLGLSDLARGVEPGPQPVFDAYVYTRDIRNDIHWLRANLTADHHDPFLLTRPRVTSFLELLRPLIGRESWDHFDVHDLGITWIILRRTLGTLFHGVFMVMRNASLKHRLVASHRQIRARIAAGQIKVRSLLFLCYGNICRSPFAAELARGRLPGLRSESAGFHRTVGRESPPDFVEVAASLGVELGANRSRRATREMIAAADLILVMDLDNYRDLVREFPEAAAKTTLLGLFAADAHALIQDPYGAPELEVRRTLALIQAGVEGLAAVLEPASRAAPIGEAAKGGHAAEDAVPASSVAAGPGSHGRPA